MNRASFPHMRRPITLMLLVGVVLILGFGDTPWVTSARVGSTIPKATATSVPTATPGSIVEPAPPLASTATPGPLTSPTPAVATGGGSCTVVGSPGGVQIGVVTVPVDTLPSHDPKYVNLRACKVTFTDPNPVQVCFAYTDADLARVRNNPAALVIIYYDPATQQWTELSYTIDPVTKQICGTLLRSGIVDLVLRADQITTLPNTSGNMPDSAAVPAAPAPVAAAPAAPVAVAAVPAAPAAAAPAAPVAADVAREQPAAVNVVAPAAPVVGAETTTNTGLPTTLWIVLGVAAVLFAVVMALGRRSMASSSDE